MMSIVSGLEQRLTGIQLVLLTSLTAVSLVCLVTFISVRPIHVYQQPHKIAPAHSHHINLPLYYYLSRDVLQEDWAFTLLNITRSYNPISQIYIICDNHTAHEPRLLRTAKHWSAHVRRLDNYTGNYSRAAIHRAGWARLLKQPGIQAAWDSLDGGKPRFHGVVERFFAYADVSRMENHSMFLALDADIAALVNIDAYFHSTIASLRDVDIMTPCPKTSQFVIFSRRGIEALADYLAYFWDRGVNNLLKAFGKPTYGPEAVLRVCDMEMLALFLQERDNSIVRRHLFCNDWCCTKNNTWLGMESMQSFRWFNGTTWEMNLECRYFDKLLNISKDTVSGRPTAFLMPSGLPLPFLHFQNGCKAMVKPAFAQFNITVP